MVVLSTTAQMLFSTNGLRKSFVVEADPANTTNNVRISSDDPNVVISFITLLKGQQIAFNNWSGTLYALASANNPSVYVQLVDEGVATITSKGPGA